MDSNQPDPRESFAPVAEKYLTSAAHAKPDELAQLVQRIEPIGGTILDIGTGAGHFAYAFSPRVDRVIAVDVTQEMLDIVAREAQSRGLSNIETHLSSAENLGFVDASIDGVACRLAAHHFDDVTKFVGHIARVLKPGAWVVIVDTVGPESLELQDELDEIERLRDPSHRHDLSTSEWGRLIDGAGLDTEWVDVRRKSLDLEDWLERMEVPEGRRPTLRDLILDSEGDLRKYFSPGIGERPTFDLWEMTLFARRPESGEANPSS
jgi:SAM-dependent methyltransferase